MIYAFKMKERKKATLVSLINIDEPNYAKISFANWFQVEKQEQTSEWIFKQFEYLNFRFFSIDSNSLILWIFRIYSLYYLDRSGSQFRNGHRQFVSEILSQRSMVILIHCISPVYISTDLEDLNIKLFFSLCLSWFILKYIFLYMILFHREYHLGYSFDKITNRISIGFVQQPTKLKSHFFSFAFFLHTNLQWKVNFYKLIISVSSSYHLRTSSTSLRIEQQETTSPSFPKVSW